MSTRLWGTTPSTHVNTIAMTRVSDTYLTARLISTLIGTVIAIAVITIPVFLFVPREFFTTIGGTLLIAAIVVVIAIILFASTISVIEARSYRYGFDEDTLYVESGIIGRQLHIVPVGRLQYIDVSEGPITRMLGLASVTMNTAGHSSISIPGLPASVAADIRDRLASATEARRGRDEDPR